MGNFNVPDGYDNINNTPSQWTSFLKKLKVGLTSAVISACATTNTGVDNVENTTQSDVESQIKSTEVASFVDSIKDDVWNVLNRTAFTGHTKFSLEELKAWITLTADVETEEEKAPQIQEGYTETEITPEMFAELFGDYDYSNQNETLSNPNLYKVENYKWAKFEYSYFDQANRYWSARYEKTSDNEYWKAIIKINPSTIAESVLIYEWDFTEEEIWALVSEWYDLHKDFEVVVRELYDRGWYELTNEELLDYIDSFKEAIRDTEDNENGSMRYISEVVESKVLSDEVKLAVRSDRGTNEVPWDVENILNKMNDFDAMTTYLDKHLNWIYKDWGDVNQYVYLNSIIENSFATTFGMPYNSDSLSKLYLEGERVTEGEAYPYEVEEYYNKLNSFAYSCVDSFYELVEVRSWKYVRNEIVNADIFEINSNYFAWQEKKNDEVLLASITKY